ncbi:hypothetical protein PR048_019990 [Dryococelus australis]|uniref:Uncharacterized protein n=1 Tax=Dryococelus australis TaxID=614101 RepID=A0ABQ9H521_9NEOP|nr:hypothetical protein PR048_019990 [Dryococelus australis]
MCENAKPIPGTEKLHAFLPVMSQEITVKRFSNETVDRGFVMSCYGSGWWSEYVLIVSECYREVHICFLHPRGVSPSYAYPQHSDIINISIGDVHTTVDPRTANGRTYVLPAFETKTSDDQLRKWKT